MIMLAKNNTVENLSIYIGPNGKKLEIPLDGQVDLLENFTRFEISKSDIPYHIDEENLILNDGEKDLTKLIALKWAWDIPIQEEQRDRSGKLRVHQTSRKLGTRIMWIGVGDDPEDVTNVGGGAGLSFDYKIDQTEPLVQYVDFNIVENETWLHEGYLTWKDGHVDLLTLDMVPRTTAITTSSGTYYNLYGGYMIIPAAGDGTIEITSDITTHSGGLIYMPNDDLDNPSTAFWDADWNTSTKRYENITAAPTGNGRYNMFSTEVVFARFINKIPLLESGFIALNSSDTDQMGHGMRLKMIGETNITTSQDHNWSVACIMCLHRKRSI